MLKSFRNKEIYYTNTCLHSTEERTASLANRVYFTENTIFKKHSILVSITRYRETKSHAKSILQGKRLLKIKMCKNALLQCWNIKKIAKQSNRHIFVLRIADNSDYRALFQQSIGTEFIPEWCFIKIDSKYELISGCIF